MAKIRNKDNSKYWQERGETITWTLLVGMWNDTAALENSLTLSYNTKYTIIIQQSYGKLRHLFQRNRNSCSLKQTKICTWRKIAALFIIATNWNQHRCPSQVNG